MLKGSASFLVLVALHIDVPSGEVELAGAFVRWVLGDAAAA